jgi:hypothetical protein
MKCPIYNLSRDDEMYCLDHAKRMVAGFSTYSFKHGKKQSEDVYFIGKAGEFAFYKFLTTFKNNKDFNIVHTPFREKYDKLNFNDDFIISISDEKYQFEVRTKGRTVEPEEDFECCTDSIKPNLIYVFISYNKRSRNASILGYATWDNFKDYATVALKNDENSNFVHKVNEFNIKIKYLTNINNLIGDLRK